jgi:hypothetical protein
MTLRDTPELASAGGSVRRVAAALVVALVAALLTAWPQASRADSVPVAIEVLSGRADMVTGGSSLLAVDLPTGASRATVKVGETDVSRAFTMRSDGRYEGLVTGLPPGDSVVTASVPGVGTASITLTDHPTSGPVFSGPQLEPWTCQATAGDPTTCDQPPTYAYYYKSTDPTKSGLQPYDPKSPPSDVATTTTDTGVTMPFIVRIETGYLDRDQYKIATLWDFTSPWTTFDPQASYNHKLLIIHGAGCGVSYAPSAAPDMTNDSPSGGGPSIYSLGRGFAVMSTALDNAGHECNPALEADSLVMTKEYLVKKYGTVSSTIGFGCSGGSLAEQWIANAYPGIYQGIVATCSFPDAWSTATQFLDYHLLLRYFGSPTGWGTGVAWTPAQMASVEGHPDPANAEVSEQAQWHVAVPTDPCPGTTDANRYDAKTNPDGVRCTITDGAVNLLGRNPQSAWSPAEVAAGHGFALPPVDNVGVQYGLDALRTGTITPEMFVDLNQKIGGMDIDTNPTTGRISMGAPALANAYRTGLVNEANNLDQTPIIDCRGPDPGLFHDSYRAFALRARLDRAHGNHAGQLIWEGPAPIVADLKCEHDAVEGIDRWIDAIGKDAGSATLAQKVAADKPADLTDRCYDGNGDKLSDSLCGQAVVPTYGTPRTVAGDAITTDTNKCRLKPLDRSSYTTDPGGLPIGFTDQQWARLQAIFPNGVCDFSQPGVDQQPTVPWQTYQDSSGSVIYGGTPMGASPASTFTPVG